MSQLDISIPFNQLLTIIIFLYLYISYVLLCVRNYLQNQKSRSTKDLKSGIDKNKLNNILWLKKILKY